MYHIVFKGRGLCVRVYVHACVRACVRACMCARSILKFTTSDTDAPAHVCLIVDMQFPIVSVPFYVGRLQPTIVAHLRRLQIEVVDCSKDRRGGVLRVTL